MRLLIVSNRLPITIKKENKKFIYEHSMGGLVTGINDYLESLSKHSQPESSHVRSLWIGWPGIMVEEKNQSFIKAELLEKFHSYPVFLPEVYTIS